MSDLNARLIVKASATAGESPQAADLEVAEIAVNTADAKLFTKHSDGSVVELTSASGGGGSSVSSLSDLDDVTFSNEILTVTDLNTFNFSGSDVPVDGDYRVWASPAFGLGMVAVDSGTTLGSIVYVHESDGIQLKSEVSQIIRLSGDEAQTDNQPELRWESGSQVGGSNTGGYVGLKLAAGQTDNFTYTLPLGEAQEGRFLQTDATGQLSWSDSLTFGSPAFAITSGIALNYEEDGTDSALSYANGPSAMSTDAQVGTKSIRFNVLQSDAEYCQGTWPSSPYGDTNYLGTRAFTFQTWFKNLNPELPGTLNRYHRMISGDGGSNQENRFQIRTNGSGTGAQGAWQLQDNAAILTGGTVVTDSNWHHLVVQHNGFGTYKMFLDGVIDGTVTLATPKNFEDGTGFILGGRGDFAADTFFQGNLDATEIIVGVELYDNTGFTPPTTAAGRTIVLQERTQLEIASVGQLSDVDTDTTAPTDGQALIWDNAAAEWKPGTVATDLADLDDVENVTPSTGELLYSDNGEYKHKPISEILTGRSTATGVVSSTVTSDTGMAGLNGFYADTAEMEADGFTSFGGLNQDDVTLAIPDAAFADYAQVDFLTRGVANLGKIRLNTNGVVFLNQTAVTKNGRSGNYAADHSNVSLAVAWCSQDTETRRSGYKEVTQDGTDWFVVRVDMKVPYNDDSGGYPLETWFGKDGRIRQYFGSKIGAGSDLTFGITRQGIAHLGTNVTNVSGLNGAGGQRIEYQAAATVLGFAGAKLEDLSDVGTPADDQFLVYDAASSNWVPEPVPTTPVDANSHTLPQLFGIGAHVSFDASAGGSFDFATDTIASGNVSNITRTATGKFTIEFDNDFASNAYTAVCTAGDQDYSGSGASPRCVNVVSRSAGSMDIVVERSDDAVQDDEGYIAVMVIGLLA